MIRPFRILRHLTGAAVAVFALAAALVIAAFLYLARNDLPPVLCDRLLDQLSDEGIRVTTARLTWKPWWSVVGRDASVYLLGEEEPLCRADEVQLDFAREAGVLRLESIRLVNARLDLAEAMPFTARPQSPPDLALVALGGRVELERAGAYRVYATGRLPDVADVVCTIRVGPAPAPAAAPLDPERPHRRAAERVRAIRRTVEEVIREINRYSRHLQVHEPVRLRTAVEVERTPAPTERVTVEIEAGPSTVAGVPLDAWRVAAMHKDGRLAFRGITAASGPSRLQAEGAYTYGDRRYDGRALARIEPALAHAIAAACTTSPPAAGLPVAPLVLAGEVRGCTTNRWPEFAKVSLHAPESGAAPTGGVAALLGTAVYSNGLAEVRGLRLDLPRPADLLPPAWRAALDRARVALDAPVAATLDAGPAAPADLPRRVRGTLTAAHATVAGVDASDIAARVEREGDAVALRDFGARLGTYPDAGTVRGAARYDTASGRFAGTLSANAAAPLVLPFVPPSVRRELARVAFEDPLTIDGDFAGSATNAAALVITGSVRGGAAARYDERVESIAARLRYTPEHVRVHDIRVVQATGVLTGSVDVALDRERVAVAASATVPPGRAARLITPNLAELLEPYAVDGAVLYDLRADLAFDAGASHAIETRVRAERVAWDRLRGGPAVFDLAVSNGNVHVTNAVVDWCGGRAEWSGQFARPPGATNHHAALRVAVRDADLKRIVRVFREIEDERSYEGSVAGAFTLDGELTPRFLATATGAGNIRVKEGYLLTIPLLGGLSEYLSALIPGLGYASQREFRADFVIADGRIWTRNAQLLGEVFSIKAGGSVSFEGDLDFRVEVQLMKEGLTAAVLRVVTAPLTKALEFRLRGTIANPRWRPVNTPRRLLDFFQRQIKGLREMLTEPGEEPIAAPDEPSGEETAPDASELPPAPSAPDGASAPAPAAP